MAREIIIGKEGTQKCTIKGDSVSRQHAKLTILDDGQIRLEDLGSKNGTFVRNENGDFERIKTAYVKQDTVIRLGQAGVHSYICWVHHLMTDTPENYSYEFAQIINMHKNDVAKEQTRLLSKNDLREKAAIGAPLIGLALSFLCSDNPILIRGAITIPSMAVGLFFMGFSKKLRDLSQRRQKLIVCPNCGRPLSDYDLQQQQCSACKAHS